MYWWTPDDSFLDISPQPLVFPPRDPVAQSQGVLTTSFEKIDIAKVVSADLDSLAPSLVQLFQSSQCLVLEVWPLQGLGLLHCDVN